METANKEVIEKKTYVHDENHKEYASKGVGNTGLGLGIAGTALGLLALNGNADCSAGAELQCLKMSISTPLA